MSSFTNAFSKDEKRDNLLGYDDSAFLFFAGTILFCVLVPWTWRFVSVKLWTEVKPLEAGNRKHCQCSSCINRLENARKKEQAFSARMNWQFFAQFSLLVILWLVFVYVALLCTQTSEIKSFDPYDILEIDTSATDKQIKKAYRVMSLKFHPDKNPNDPAAGAKFVMISKAYQSLTDEVAKRNFQKFGNPDGPGFMKVGLGLPKFLVEENYQLFLLLFFFTILLIIIPIIFICYYRHLKKYAQNGIQIKTVQFLSCYMSEGTRMKNGPEILAASAESRELQLRPSDNQEMLQLIRDVTEPRKRLFTLPIIVRNYFLILGHMQRLHHLMSPHLKADLNELLSKSMVVLQSMLEIAVVSNWFMGFQSLLDFQRSIIQCLGMRNSSLLQIPHMDDAMIKTLKGKTATTDLQQFINKPPEERKMSGKANEAQMADVSAFCSHVSDMEVSATVSVDDENEIVVGDICTVLVKMTRMNLQDGESLGPIHAPLFPVEKYEEWWICVADESGALLGFAKNRCQDKYIQEKIQFSARKAGKIQLTVHCFCDSYSGLDQTITLQHRVYTEKEVQREVFVHAEDVALDDEPTLFQQMLGPLAGGDESSDDGKENDDEEEDSTEVENITSCKHESDTADNKHESDTADNKLDGDTDADDETGKHEDI